jgi:hypothetical protein
MADHRSEHPALFVALRPAPIVNETRGQVQTNKFDKKYKQRQLAVHNVITDGGIPLRIPYRETYDVRQTPANWEKLQLVASSGDPRAPLFYTSAQLIADPNKRQENSEACEKLKEDKLTECKNKLPAGMCDYKMSEQVLEERHNQHIKCSNIRAFENQANCPNLTPNDQGHAISVIKSAAEAQICIDAWNKKRGGQSEQEQEQALKRLLKEHPELKKGEFKKYRLPRKSAPGMQQGRKSKSKARRTSNRGGRGRGRRGRR